MRWAKKIEIEDLLTGDQRLVYEHCSKDVLLTLLEKFAGRTISLRSEPVTDMKRRYIRQHAGTESVKEMALKLDCSEEFVYSVLRSDQDEEDIPAPPNLFTNSEDQ